MTTYRPLWTLQLVKDRSIPYDSRPVLDSPVAVVQTFNRLFGCPAVEHMMAFYCDSRRRLLGVVQIGQGSSARCPVDTASIARVALLAGADAVLLAHNHPSGDVGGKSVV